MVQQIFHNAVDTLTEEDQGLPQVNDLLPMLQRGIAVHHSGLLPVLKELGKAFHLPCAERRGHLALPPVLGS